MRRPPIRPIRLSRRRVLAGTALAAVGLVRPAAGRPATPVPVTGTPPAGDGAAGPPPRARLAAALAGLDALATDALTRSGVPGMAVGVVAGDAVVHLAGYGVASLVTNATVGPDTVFQIASLSKPVTTTVVAALVGSGIVDWDDPVVVHDPGFALADPWVTANVTVRDFFCHRSGLPPFAGDLLEQIGYEQAEILRRLRYVPLADRFRARYAYTNFGFTEAAVAAARAAGTRWERVAADVLFRPLGMTDSSYRHWDYVTAPDRADLHVPGEGGWMTSAGRQPDAQAPAGGVSASARDLTTWLRLHLNGGEVDGRQIVDAAALAETHRPLTVSQPPANPGTDRAIFSGLGWMVFGDARGRARWAHSGGFTDGASTHAQLAPGAGLGIVVLTNGVPLGIAEGVAATFLDQALDGTPERDWFASYRGQLGDIAGTALAPAAPAPAPDAPSPALSAAAYVGSYANDFYGPLEIQAADGGLRLTIGPARLTASLVHLDRDVVRLLLAPGDPGSPARFEIGGDGRAVAVTVDLLATSGEGLARFERL